MLSKKIFHAVEAVLYIAYNAGQGPMSGRDIAQKQGLPPRYLEQLMQKLVRAGILRGVRGPHGGYVLARERRRVTVGEICESLGVDTQDAVAASTPLGNKIIRPVWDGAQEKMMGYLKQVSLAELCERAQEGHIRKESDGRMDFTI